MNGDKNWLVNYAAPQLAKLLNDGWEINIGIRPGYSICNIGKDADDWRKAEIYQGNGEFVADAIMDAYEQAYGDKKRPATLQHISDE